MSGGKKIFKKAVKVASLGAVGSGGWGNEAVSVLSGGLINPNAAKDAADAQKEIMDAQLRANKEALAQQEMFDRQAAVMQANAAELANANAMDSTTKFEVGGSADAQDSNNLLTDMRKRKRTDSTSSQLGIY